MNDYEKLDNLNDLADQMLGSIDNYSEHLLYQTDKFLDIAKQMSPLIKSLRDPEKKLPVSDEQRKAVLARATKLQVFFNAVKETKEKMDKLDKAGLYSSNDAINNDAIAYEYMLKMKLAVADIKDRSTTGRFSDGIKTQGLNDIFSADIKDSKIDIRTGYLGTMSNLFLRKENSTNRVKARQALKNGTIQQHLALDVVDREIYTRFEIDPIDTVKELVESKRVQEVIKRYHEAEQYWLGSDLTEAEERASRRAFMETYSDELNGLYQALNVNSVPNANNVRNDIVNYLNNKELSGMMRDYTNMMLDRDNNLAKQEPWSYLFTEAAGMTKEEVEFRAIPTKNPVYDYKSAEPNAAQKEGLKEFHKWIYRNCDFKGLGEAFGSNGSARDYMEDFMKAPYETQIKTLYLLETKSRRNGPIPDENSEEFKNYVPDFKKLKDVMVSSKFKFWQRLNGKKHRWNKIKECMDRINSSKAAVKNEAPVNNNNAEVKNVAPANNNNVAGVNVAPVNNSKAPNKKGGQAFDEVVKTGRTVAGLVTAPTALFDKESKLVTGGTYAGDLLGAIQGVKALAGAIGKIGSDPQRTAGESFGIFLDGTQGLANIVRAGASSYNKLGFVGAELAKKIASHAGGGLNVLLATRAAYDANKLENRNDQFILDMADIIKENKNKNFDEKEKKALISKIMKHGRVLRNENTFKAHGRRMDMIGSGINSVGYGLSILGSTTAMPIALAASSVAAPIIIAIKNKREINDMRKTIDADLYANDAKKQSALKRIKDNIDKRLKRIPNTKYYKGIREKLKTLKAEDSRLLHHIRKNEARKNGCINEKQFKNFIIDRTKKEINEMYDMEEKYKNADEKHRNLGSLARAGAEKLIELAGERKPVKAEQPKAEQPVENVNNEVHRVK